MWFDADVNVRHKNPIKFLIFLFWIQVRDDYTGLIPRKLKRWNMITFSLEFMWWLSACQEMKHEGNTGQMEVSLCEKPGSWESKRITDTFPQDSTDPKYQLKTYASSLLLLLLLQLCSVSISFYIEKWWHSSWKYTSEALLAEPSGDDEMCCLSVSPANYALWM